MTNYAEHYIKYIEGRHYTGPYLVDPELDDWVLVTNLGDSHADLNGRIECNPKKGLIRRASDRFVFSIQKNGDYARVTIRFPGEKGTHTPHVHTIICSVVYGYQPRGLTQVNHKDFNKMNSSANNLEWCDSTYNSWYNKLRPQTYYVYTIDSFKKIREFPNYLSVLKYYNIKSFSVVTMKSIKKYSTNASYGIATIRGAFITQYDYGEIIDLPLPTKKSAKYKAVSVYDKNSGMTFVFSAIITCAKWLHISDSWLHKILKSKNTSDSVPSISQYIVTEISWEEYYSFYDKQFNDKTIHIDLYSFNKQLPERTRQSNAMSDEDYEQAYIAKQIQKLDGILSTLNGRLMNQENSNKLSMCNNKLRRIAYKNKSTIQETTQCQTNQLTQLLLCALPELSKTASLMAPVYA